MYAKLNYYIDNSLSIRLAVVILLISVFILRVPDLLVRPQFWAEDGSIFFREAYCFGPNSLFNPYQGYYHLVPRLTALLSSYFNQLYAPAIYCGTALFSTAIVLYLVLSPRLLLPYKPLLALLIVIIPTGYEVYGNITNIQWYLAIGLLIIFLMKPSESQSCLILETVFVLLSGLTGPFILLLIPGLALMLWPNWSIPLARHRMIFLTAAAFGAASFQAWALMKYGINAPVVRSKTDFQFMDYVHIISIITFLQIGTPYLRGVNNIFHLMRDNTFSTSLLFISTISLLVITLLYTISISRKKYVVEKRMITYFGLVILLASYYKLRVTIDALGYLGSGHRYLFIPSIMLSWLIVLMFKDGIIKYIAAVLISLLLITAIYDYRRAPLIDYNWSLWVSKARFDSQTRIPINPPGWSINMRCDEPHGDAFSTR